MQEEYIKRINTVLAFIDDNLDADLSLEKISGVVHYSPFHLHRLFKAVTNETLNSYITRKRMEKVASLLIRRKEMTVTELVLKYGFASNSSFTRTFKKFYGVSPSEFRKLSPGKYSKIGQAESKNGQGRQLFEEYVCDIDQHKKWIEMNANIEIKEMPRVDLAYINHIGVEGVDAAFEKLVKWATPKGLLDRKEVTLIRIYHDSFKITAPDKIRMSVGIVLTLPAQVGGEFGLASIEKGKFIVGHFEIEPKDFGQAWSSLFVWMNENGFKKREGNPFEIIHNNFNDHPEKKCIVDLCIPIE
jgi:AraC family transcriptional regulator